MTDIDLGELAAAGQVAGRFPRGGGAGTLSDIDLGETVAAGQVAARFPRGAAGCQVLADIDLGETVAAGQVAGRFPRGVPVCGVVLTDFDRSVWGYGLDLFGSVSFPWPLGPSLFTAYSGHLAAGIDAVATTIDVTGDEPLLGGLISPPAPPTTVVLEIGSESVLLTDTGTGPDDWTVSRGLLGTAVPHASGAAVTIDDHGLGSIEADAITYTQPIAGTFVVAWGAYITDNGYGDHIAGTWVFELRVNGSTVDTATVEPTAGEVNAGWFATDTPDVALGVGDELTIVATDGDNPDSLDELSWAYIRVYGSY